MTSQERDMDDDASSASEVRFDVKPKPETHFAWMRTRLSMERTLMSWIRTATALIGFGFTIVQFFDRFSKMGNVKAAMDPELPRYLGLALIVTGMLALSISLTQYWSVVRYLDGKQFVSIGWSGDRPSRTPVVFVAVSLAVVGLIAFVSVVIRTA
jgi:putative membrane protein